MKLTRKEFERIDKDFLKVIKSKNCIIWLEGEDLPLMEGAIGKSLEVKEVYKKSSYRPIVYFVIGNTQRTIGLTTADLILRGRKLIVYST